MSEPSVWRDHGCDAANGTVVLIDEIDKSELDMPNGLLEALGSGALTPPSVPTVTAKTNPLNIITTNEERTLPDPFVRRCLVLYMRLPEDRDDLVGYLVRRGRAHFQDKTLVSDLVLKRAATLLVDNRSAARENHVLPLPGQAEFLDLVRAVHELAPRRSLAQSRSLERVGAFALRKSQSAE